MATEYVRPVLCRLCGFPAPDGGVPVCEVNREKLSEWCMRTIDVKSAQEGLEKAVFCQFCLFDPRLYKKFLIDSNEKNIFKSQFGHVLQTYISENLIERCAVRIEPLPEITENAEVTVPLSKNKRKKVGANTKVHKCIYCSKSFSTKLDRNGHISKSHRDISTFRCSLCFKFFRTKEEKNTHMKHLHNDKLICVYCSSSFVNYDQKVSHLLQNHKDLSTQYKCKKSCNNLFFWTQSELDCHMKNVHTDPRKLRKCVYCSKLVVFMSSHLRTYHKAEAIKCNFQKKCNAYFHSEEEMEIHIDQIHNRAYARVKKPCIYCTKMFPSGTLSIHIRIMHSAEALRCNANKTCKKYFKCEEDREKHILEVHPQVQKVVDVTGSCIYCKKMFSWDTIARHVKKVHSSVAIRCNFAKKCLTYFHSEKERKKHVKEIHSKQKCHLCQKEVQGIRGIIYHMKRHEM